MQIWGRFYDGHVAVAQIAIMRLQGSAEHGSWIIHHAETDEELARWPAQSIINMPSAQDELRLAATEGMPGARLVITIPLGMAQARRMMPALDRQSKVERRNRLRLLGGATTLLAGVITLYLVGIPVLAGYITAALPPQWERDIGEAVATQFEDSFAQEYGFELCDADPQSTPNQAISRLVADILQDTNTPFGVQVSVVRTTLPNAFALPGGRVYYLSAFLDDTETADEFAGVLAHEIGHVVHRHGMEQLVSSAGTGLLIGFVLGDMTGISVAGGLGAALIDSRNSRDAEREADAFAAQATKRMGFNATALADLLDRVASDDEFSRAMALLSSHPLTSERRKALAGDVSPGQPATPVMSDADWRAIRSMCDEPE